MRFLTTQRFSVTEKMYSYSVINVPTIFTSVILPLLDTYVNEYLILFLKIYLFVPVFYKVTQDKSLQTKRHGFYRVFCI